MIIKFSGIFLFLLLLVNSINAQLCAGSLGDPIVNITFGQGPNPGGALSAATTSYQYFPNDCPGDGFYSVRNNTTACFVNTWHTLVADHTGNTNGYFMLVNASYQPGAFYLDTVRGLCDKTTYEFAAWIMNVLLPTACPGGGNQPDITLAIEKTDGTLLQSYNTGTIPTQSVPTWNQYGSFFTTPAGVTEIVLRIVNKAPGGCGNDLALDDITFRPCGPLLSGMIDGLPGYAVAYCEGPSRQFILSCTVSGGFTNPVFQWQMQNAQNPNWSDISGENNNMHLATFAPNTPPGNYQFRLAVAESGNINFTNCRVYSQIFTVTVNANPVTAVNNDGPACSGSNLMLSATGGAQYAWNGPNGFTATGTPVTLNSIQLNQAGKYYVTISSSAGCTHLDSTTIVVNPAPIALTAFASDSICTGDSIQLTATGGTGFQWAPSTGLSRTDIFNPKASPRQTTIYTVIVSNAFFCKDTAFSTVYVIPTPVANAGPDKSIFEGQSTQLSGSIGGQGNSFFWSPALNIDDIHSLQPFVHPTADQNYTLTVVSGSGCGTASDRVLINVYKDIFIPNAFSPNGDGLNDTWNIPALAACSSFEVTVYSRWGQPVFQTKNMLRPWDGTSKGTALPNGIYVYYIKTDKSSKLIKGTVVIIR